MARRSASGPVERRLATSGRGSDGTTETTKIQDRSSGVRTGSARIRNARFCTRREICS